MSKIVLCVDDSVTMQQVADITFRGTEFTYVGARSYDEGLEKAKGQKPTLVLADSHMPGGKSGYDLCLALKYPFFDEEPRRRILRKRAGKSRDLQLDWNTAILLANRVFTGWVQNDPEKAAPAK